MKKGFFLSLLILNFFVAYTQSVGINTDASLPNASAMLDVKSSTKGMLMPRMLLAQRNAIPSPAAGLMIYQTDNTPGYYYYNGTVWVSLASGGAVNYWSSNNGNIYSNNVGNVGIGINNPQFKLTVQTQSNQFGLVHTDGDVVMASYIGSFQAGLGGWLGTRTPHPLYFFTNNSAQQMALLPNGNVGIGTINPTNKLQINGPTPGFVDYDFAIGRNAQTMAIYQGPNFTNLQSTANISLNPKNGTGYVGINTGSNPNNRLQIGSLGPVIFNGNDLVIGNGTNALAIYQSNTSTLLASTTDIVLMPRNNGQGRVGINTNTPGYPLHVQDFVASPLINYSYMKSGGAYEPPVLAGTYGYANVSIYASSNVMAQEFDTYSDARIKTVACISNSANDLQTITSIAITDYTMKDVVKYGDKAFKKVIAQEVEKVYPLAVSKHTGFVPNVYQVTTKVEKKEDGYLLTFTDKHNINMQAKKLQVLLDGGESMQHFSILLIPSDRQVLVDASNINGDKIFVYGEEVDDFRTVDYDGLTTLNISATQELSKQVKQQQALLEAQDKKIEALMEAVKLLKDKACGGLL